MGVMAFGDVIVHGNFAEVEPEMPKDFKYDRDARWLEPYPFEHRERIGSVICTCEKLEVSYAPYYGFDYDHLSSCNLVRQLKARPQLYNLPSYDHLPSVVFYEGSTVPADTRQGLYVDKRGRASKIKVRVIKNQTIALIGGC